MEEAVRVARSRDQSGVPRAGNGPEREHELGAATMRLGEERDEVRARLAIMSRDMENLIAASADSNADDEHDPEGQTIAYERSQLAALIQGAEDHLAGIEAAMIRLKEGTYGICEVCGQPIPAARLEARPTARTCIRHTTPTRA
jgi:DnaK suppressor protein